MPPRAANNPFWSTASFGEAATTSPMELSELGEHLDSCSKGRWFTLRCAADAMNGFVSARLMTTLVAIGALMSVGLLIV